VPGCPLKSSDSKQTEISAEKMVSNVKQTVQKLSGTGQFSIHRSLETALLFVLMNVDYLSRVVHFDRDLSADSDIPEHAALGSEAITPLPSRRR
jgi:hypothetical protein